jgi:hypothetical protein
MQTQATLPAILQRPPRFNPNLRVELGANLSNAFERAIAWIIADHLSDQSGQFISALDLVGISLYLWSEMPLVDQRDWIQYLNSGESLEGLLVRSAPGDASAFISNVLETVDPNLEIAAADTKGDEAPTVKFIQVTPGNGILEREQASCPTYNELARLLNQSAAVTTVNFLHNLFSDLSLVLLRSDEYPQPWTAYVQTPWGKEHLFGPLLVFRKKLNTCGFELIGLTGHQVSAVRQELRIETRKAKPELVTLREVSSCF